MWELDCEECWAPKNWCFWTVVLEKTLESPLDCKEIQPDHSEGDKPWDFFGRTDAKAGTPVIWPPHVKSWLTGKDSDAGREWGQEEKGMTEDEMAGWHYQLDGREFWVNSGSWWWTGRLCVWRFMGLQRVRHDWATELNWTERNCALRKYTHYNLCGSGGLASHFNFWHCRKYIKQHDITCDSRMLVVKMTLLLCKFHI